MRSFITLILLLLSVQASQAEETLSGGGVPSTVLLSVGFGDALSDDSFIVINGTGAIGIYEFFESDFWLSGGLYTSLAFAGKLIDKDDKGVKMDVSLPDVVDLPSEGWGISPGVVLGFTLGMIPYVDVHLFGFIGPSFALLTRYQRQSGKRVKVDERDTQLGYDYGGMMAIAYTGSNPWLRGLTLGMEGGYHENSFDRWHLGISVGVSF